MEIFDKKKSNSPLLSVRKSNEIVPQSNGEITKKLLCTHNENCQCEAVREELAATISCQKVQLKDHRSRSKSEPRISPPITGNRANSFTFFDDTKTTNSIDYNNLILSNHENSMESLHRNTNSKSMSLTRGGDFRGTIIGKDKLQDIKMYNTKTLPKRITNLRKNRNKTTKETFKFYMDLPDSSYDDTTVLRITESADNINEIKANDVISGDNFDNIEMAQEAEETIGLKRDSEIISDLLKDKNQCIERIRKKPPKKKSFDNGRDSNHLIDVTKSIEGENHLTPSLISSVSNTTVDQQPNCNVEATENLMTKLNTIQKEIHIPEPIYESLLRNVHVPYKYSPVLSRSKLHKLAALKHQQIETKLLPAFKTSTQTISKNQNANETDHDKESDYVTLMFNDTGQMMEKTGNNVVNTSSVIQKDDISQFRNSDSNINYNKLCRDSSLGDDDIDLMTSSKGNFPRRSSFNLKSSMNLIQRLISIKAEAAMINGNVNNEKITDATSMKSVNRQISDVSEMFNQAFIHKQGSETLGSRIAQLDYADPKTLFTTSTNIPTATSQSNILINKICNIKQERDSVFSLTSSNDSVNEGNNNNNKQQTNEFNEKSYHDDDNNDDEYEKNVEDSLENNIFRDSAIYSDDNVGRCENIYETPTDLQFYGIEKSIILPEQSVVLATEPPPTPPPRNCPPKVPKKPAIGRTNSIQQPPPALTPPLPTKPSSLYAQTSKSRKSVSSICEAINEQSVIKSDVSIVGKSWVSKQIKNFEK